MKYARIQNSLVAEIIETYGDIKTMFHPSIEFVQCADSVRVGWCYENGAFIEPKTKQPPIEELRAAMVVSKVKAMQNLKKLGRLNLVLDVMDTEKRDSDIRILWDFSDLFHRTDATLIKFCKEKMGLDDKGIDNLFL